MHNETAVGATANVASGDAESTAVEKKTRYAVVPFYLKAIAFSFAVVSLSWFFEGWRQMQKGATLSHFAILMLGTTSTIGLLGLQGYWIYIEEKIKGTLKKRIGIFERIYEYQQERSGLRNGDKQ